MFCICINFISYLNRSAACVHTAQTYSIYSHPSLWLVLSSLQDEQVEHHTVRTCTALCWMAAEVVITPHILILKNDHTTVITPKLSHHCVSREQPTRPFHWCFLQAGMGTLLQERVPQQCLERVSVREREWKKNASCSNNRLNVAMQCEIGNYLLFIEKWWRQRCSSVSVTLSPDACCIRTLISKRCAFVCEITKEKCRHCKSRDILLFIYLFICVLLC